MVLWSATLSQPTIPRGTAQVCSRSRSCPGSAVLISAAGLTATFLFEIVEVGEERLEILWRQQIWRHQITGFRSLRVEDPAAEVATRIGQPPGADREAARDMRQVGSGRRAGDGALDRMTHDAGSAQEHLLSALLLLILRRPCRLALLAFPFGEA